MEAAHENHPQLRLDDHDLGLILGSLELGRDALSELAGNDELSDHERDHARSTGLQLAELHGRICESLGLNLPRAVVEPARFHA